VIHRPSDLDARLAAWLEEGPSSGPDEVLSRTFARARSTQQVRGSLHRLTHHLRFQPMNAMIKIAAVAVIALVVGVAIDPLRPTTPYAATGPSPSPSPSPVLLPSGGTLDAGSYYIDAGADVAPARFTFTVPAGWASDGAVKNSDPQYPAAGWEGEVGFETWIVTHVFSDACHHTTLVDAGTTVDELATALLAQQGLVTSGPTDVTIDGYPGQHVELVVPDSLDVSTCTNGKIRFWPGPGPDMSSGMCCIFGPGMTLDMDIVDVDGHRWVVAARTGPGASQQDRAALEDVLASIRVDHPTPSSSPSPSF
jgi:hypothetical protein